MSFTTREALKLLNRFTRGQSTSDRHIANRHGVNSRRSERLAVATTTKIKRMIKDNLKKLKLIQLYFNRLNNRSGNGVHQRPNMSKRHRHRRFCLKSRANRFNAVRNVSNSPCCCRSCLLQTVDDDFTILLDLLSDLPVTEETSSLTGQQQVQQSTSQ